MEYRIENAAREHLPGIAAIESECFSLPMNEEQLAGQLPDDTHILLVALDSGDYNKVLAYVGLMSVLDEGYISDVAVSGEYRKQGIADALIRRLCGMAEERRLAFISLEVRESNAPAIALYEKHSFERVGLRKNYYEKPKEHAIIMTKYLEQSPEEQ